VNDHGQIGARGTVGEIIDDTGSNMTLEQRQFYGQFWDSGRRWSQTSNLGVSTSLASFAQISTLTQPNLCRDLYRIYITSGTFFETKNSHHASAIVA